MAEEPKRLQFRLDYHVAPYGNVVHVSIADWPFGAPATHHPVTGEPLVSGTVPDWTRIPLCGAAVTGLPSVSRRGQKQRDCYRCEDIWEKIGELLNAELKARREAENVPYHRLRQQG